MSKAEGNVECRMSNVERMTKPECPNGQRIVQGQFDIRASDFFRHLTFVIRISPPSSRCTRAGTSRGSPGTASLEMR